MSIELSVQQVPPQPVPGDLPMPPPEPPPRPVYDPTDPPPPMNDPDVVDPTPGPDVPPPMVASGQWNGWQGFGMRRCRNQAYTAAF